MPEGHRLGLGRLGVLGQRHGGQAGRCFSRVRKRHFFDLGGDDRSGSENHQNRGARFCGREGQPHLATDVGERRNSVQCLAQAGEVGVNDLHFGAGEDGHGALQDPDEETGRLKDFERGDEDLLRGQLEVEGALGEHAVFKLVAAGGLRATGPDDLFDFPPGRIADVLLGNMSALGESRRDGLPGLQPRHKVVKLLLSDLAPRNQDGAQLVLGRV